MLIFGICFAYLILNGKHETFKEKNMLNFIYGSMLTVTVITMVNIIDDNVPNSLMYWVDLYAPF